ncbi:hypothetical protein NECAME_16252 [Necator americanus]|uniref:Sulfotransferase domain-containing protein n=1 Tax=Necator americanus TaxID=51031 RepID=W2TZV5_NECAM|nr:hypothetical protein NECAME_16252 [Necator americanus]ETN86611.1 hypothetical protein NECAME_16252 [Necator americanus]
MTTITAAIFCYLTNTSEFLLNNRTISTEEYYRRFCLDQNDMTYDEVHNILGSSRVEYAVVRDPVERFLSGFVDKCIKYCNFKDNFHYYTTVSYEEGFDGILNLAKNHEMIYEKAGVPEELRRTIYTELLVGSTPHSTSGTAVKAEARNTLTANSSLLLRVTQMYYYDFIAFNFRLPILL